MKIFMIVSITLPLLFSACGGEYANGKRNIPSGTKTDTDTLATISTAKTFTDVHTALTSQCLSCHGTNGGFTLGSTSSPLPKAEAYNNIMVFVTGTAANSRLLQKATGSVTHGGGAVFNNTSYYYDLIKTWIDAGTPFDQTSFDVGTPSPMDTNTSLTSTATYADVNTVLINGGCLSCHADWANTPAQVKSRVNTGAPADSILLTKATASVFHGGSQRFTTASNEYTLLIKWIEAGAPIDGSSFDTGTAVMPITTARPGYDLPTVSAKSFTLNHKGGFAPVQGKACIQCHNSEEGKDILRFGGTLFSYIHTENAKYYQDLSNYTINIVGNSGTNLTATTRPSGTSIGHNNFYVLTDSGSFINGEMFTAYIKDSNGIVVNKSGDNTHSSSTHRDCNRCHTQLGLNSAPGRVLVPLAN